MGAYVANEVIRLMVRKGINPVRAKVLVLGLAFKANCADLRNTRVVDIIDALREYNAQLDVCDPWVDAGEAKHGYALSLYKPGASECDAIIVAVWYHLIPTLMDATAWWGGIAVATMSMQYKGTANRRASQRNAMTDAA